jgi:hypothetical protein
VARPHAIHAFTREGAIIVGQVSDFAVDWGKVQFEYTYEGKDGAVFGAFTGELHGDSLTVEGEWVERNGQDPSGKAHLHIARAGDRLVLSGSRGVEDMPEQWTIDVPRGEPE